MNVRGVNDNFQPKSQTESSSFLLHPFQDEKKKSLNCIHPSLPRVESDSKSRKRVGMKRKEAFAEWKAEKTSTWRCNDATSHVPLFEVQGNKALYEKQAQEGNMTWYEKEMTNGKRRDNTGLSTWVVGLC